VIVEAWVGNRVLGFTVEQENLIWELWRGGESLREIVRVLGETKPRIRRFLLESGGIRPVPPRPAPRRAADKAGITAGSVVTKLDDRVIPDGDSLVAAIRPHVPGDTVTLTVKDPSGATRTVQVTL
jgi:S1-C subfamily serine protease